MIAIHRDAGGRQMGREHVGPVVLPVRAESGWSRG